MPRTWTPQQRKEQSEKIKQWKPWQSSTGAITPEGKAAVSQNALKHGAYSEECRALVDILKEQEQVLADVVSIIIDTD